MITADDNGEKSENVQKVQTKVQTKEKEPTDNFYEWLQQNRDKYEYYPCSNKLVLIAASMTKDSFDSSDSSYGNPGWCP